MGNNVLLIGSNFLPQGLLSGWWSNVDGWVKVLFDQLLVFYEPKGMTLNNFHYMGQRGIRYGEVKVWDLLLDLFLDTLNPFPEHPKVVI